MFELLRLRFDLWLTRALLWLSSLGRNVEPAPETHYQLADLHFRLADVYLARRRFKLAKQHRVMANRHAALGPPPDLPPAVAMAMPVPLPPPDDDIA